MTALFTKASAKADTAKIIAAKQALDEIHAFLPCPTPDRWVENALQNQQLMLIDHANCERKRPVPR